MSRWGRQMTVVPLQDTLKLIKDTMIHCLGAMKLSTKFHVSPSDVRRHF